MSVAIKSGASTDVLIVGATSKAARITGYDSRGNDRGIKVTYRASTIAVLVAAAGTAPFFAFQGSATKTVRIQRIQLSGLTLTAVAYASIQLGKYSVAATGGTSTNLVSVPLDSSDGAATAVAKAYTAAPTAGTLIGVIASKRILLQSTTAAASGIPGIVDFDFRNQGSCDEVALRGVTQELALFFLDAPATAVSMSLEVEWTEEA